MMRALAVHRFFRSYGRERGLVFRHGRPEVHGTSGATEAERNKFWNLMLLYVLLKRRSDWFPIVGRVSDLDRGTPSRVM